jgi:hypothetical protein
MPERRFLAFTVAERVVGDLQGLQGRRKAARRELPVFEERRVFRDGFYGVALKLQPGIGNTEIVEQLQRKYG